MTEFQCESCAYRFDSERQHFRCPFCGKAGTVRATPSAEQIMSDVDSEASERKNIRENLERAR